MDTITNTFLMINDYIRTHVKPFASKYAPREPRRLFRQTLPKDHKCYDCLARDRNNDTLYCCLPTCNKELFKIGVGKNENK